MRNPIRVESAFGGPGRDRVSDSSAPARSIPISARPTRSNGTSPPRSACQGHLLRSRLRRLEGHEAHRNLRRQPPDSSRTPGPAVPPVSARRPFQGFDAINTTKSIGNSIYHSMQTKVERRSARGLTLLGAYTWSHSISNADISSVGGGSFLAGIQDYIDLLGSRSDSIFDIRHRLSDRGDLRRAVVPRFLAAAGAHVSRRLAARHDHHRANGIRRRARRRRRHHRNGHRVAPDMIAGQDPMLDRGDRTRARWFNTDAFASRRRADSARLRVTRFICRV